MDRRMKVLSLLASSRSKIRDKFDQVNTTQENKQGKSTAKNQTGLSIFLCSALLFYHGARAFSHSFR